ncbi:MAG: fumarylacetoacetate hydrolase family protein [Gammaproteobacteria bacterium]|nr:fumarylacetoacetate hydrolase family protein [Gammaproteobacteria bacterium]MDA8011709.1 fumarylacetoacetate hydrolase family protein [Gammaproteobacteria bacterium]MDA8022191.1 fumarylacetoacetate hydrolase family protein [Gammaproteobacteria bacterium]
MKLLSFETPERGASYGLLAHDGVFDLGARLPHPDLRALIAAHACPKDLQQRIGKLLPRSEQPAADYRANEIRYLPPIPSPEKIICVGINYPQRAGEYGDGNDAPAYPSIFMRAPGSLVGHGAALHRPPESAQLDYEGEIAAVIGLPGRRLGENGALRHVFGLTIMNEGSIRDWLRHGKFNVTPGKNFEHSGGIGPHLVSADEADPAAARRLCTRVNGELRQDASSADMLFPLPKLLAYISTFTALSPGDIIATGTPPGAGARMTPPSYLAPGDRVEVEVDGLGVLDNRVVDEPGDAR